MSIERAGWFTQHPLKDEAVHVVTREWFEERLEMITRTYPGEDSDLRLHRTSVFTLLGPLRFHLERQIRRRAEALGLPVDIHEDEVLDEVWD